MKRLTNVHMVIFEIVADDADSRRCFFFSSAPIRAIRAKNVLRMTPLQTLFFTLLILLQLQPTVPVTLQVRYRDGSPFEQPIQIRNDEGEPLQMCQPDRDGRCTMQLTRGLYLVEPTGTQLDAVSAAAAVEIGGRWLGITVGDEPLDYGFVIEEGAVYFDDAPNASRPQPIHPTQADLDAHFEHSDEDDVASEPDESQLAQTETPNLPDEPVSAENTPFPDEQVPPPAMQQTPVPLSPIETNARQRLTRWILFILTFTLGAVAIGWLSHKQKS